MSWDPPSTPLQFADLGNALAEGAHARYYTNKARQEQTEFDGQQKAAPDLPAAVAGDAAAIGRVAQTAPSLLGKIAPMLTRLDQHQAATLKAGADFAARGANAILQADPKDRPAIYQQMIEQGRAQGLPMDKLPPQYSPDLDPMLRFHRAQSKEVQDLLMKQQEEAGKNARHNSPGGGAAPDLEPMSGPAQLPAGTVPVPGRRADAGPVGAPQPQIAQAAPVPLPVPQEPQIVQGDGPGPTPQPVTGGQVALPPGTMPAPAGGTPPRPGSGPVPAPGPAQPQGAIWNVDPATQGGQMMGHRAKAGAPLLPAEIAGHFVYKLPDGSTVLYKPRPDAPQGYEHDPAKPGALRPIAGGPADKAGDEIDPTLRGDELLKSLAPAEASQVQGVLEGRIPLPSLSARMAPEAKRLRTLAFQADPSFDSTVFASRQKTQNDFAAGDMSKQIANANKLIGHIGDLHEASADLNNSSTPLFNAAGNLIAANRGDPRIAKFNVAKQIALEEADKFFGGGSGTTVSGMEDMKKLINSAQSPQQLQAAMAQMEKMLQSQLSAYANKFNNGMKYTGDKRVTPESLLSDDARAGLKRIADNPLGKSAAGTGTGTPNLKQMYGLD